MLLTMRGWSLLAGDIKRRYEEVVDFRDGFVYACWLLKYLFASAAERQYRSLRVKTFIDSFCFSSTLFIYRVQIDNFDWDDETRASFLSHFKIFSKFQLKRSLYKFYQYFQIPNKLLIVYQKRVKQNTNRIVDVKTSKYC